MAAGRNRPSPCSGAGPKEAPSVPQERGKRDREKKWAGILRGFSPLGVEILARFTHDSSPIHRLSLTFLARKGRGWCRPPKKTNKGGEP
jgi:hypothetical protein